MWTSVLRFTLIYAAGCANHRHRMFNFFSLSLRARTEGRAISLKVSISTAFSVEEQADLEFFFFYQWVVCNQREVKGKRIRGRAASVRRGSRVKDTHCQNGHIEKTNRSPGQVLNLRTERAAGQRIATGPSDTSQQVESTALERDRR